MESDGEEQQQSGSSQIICMTWVRKQAAKMKPDKIRLSRSELKSILSLESEKVCEQKDQNGATHNSTEEIQSSDEDDLKEFDMENYDNDGEGADVLRQNNLSDLVMFDADDDSKFDDKEYESESEDEIDALNLRDDDNLLVCARCERDFCSLEIYVHNHTSNDFYVHHDIPLSSPPLCMEWLDFDAGNADDSSITDRGNLLAVGNMDCVVEVWDLDVINTVEPAFMLGVHMDNQQSVRKVTRYSHTDAVLDLSWSPLTRKKLLSASVDRTVALWDMEKGVIERRFINHQDKVQAVEWKPKSKFCLLSGAVDGRIIGFDLRESSKQCACYSWKFDDEIERLSWNRENSSYFAATTNQGAIYYLDVRMPGRVVTSWDGHEEAIPALQMWPGGRICSASSDGYVRVWQINRDKDDGKSNTWSHRLLEERNMKMGSIHCFSCNPDVTSLLAVGGERDGVRLITAETGSGKFVNNETTAVEDDDNVENFGNGDSSSPATVEDNCKSSLDHAGPRKRHKTKSVKKNKRKRIREQLLATLSAADGGESVNSNAKFS